MVKSSKAIRNCQRGVTQFPGRAISSSVTQG